VVPDISSWTDRHTDTQTYSSQYFATAPAGEVNIDDLENSYTYELGYTTD